MANVRSARRLTSPSPNVWMRDPLLYRIRHAEHHHTGGKWCIYPMYDFAHCLSDYIEGITHSICTLEFEVHRPLYDWILENLDLPRPLPNQYEFARLSLGYTVMSKRKLMQLVDEKLVTGWDDPRMPTISGIRRRGVTAEALRALCLQHRHHQIQRHYRCGRARIRHPRRFEQTRPAPARRVAAHQSGHHELSRRQNRGTGRRQQSRRRKRRANGKFRSAANFTSSRTISRKLPPPKFFRLKPGGEVRLKYAYIIKCDEVVKDAGGNIMELRCTADLDSKTGGTTANRKVKGTIHWVSAAHAIDAEVRLYDRLFTEAEPEKDCSASAESSGETKRDFKSVLNPHSLEVVTAKCEPSLKDAKPELRYQFERLAYFALDKDSQHSSNNPQLIFNRTITLEGHLDEGSAEEINAMNDAFSPAVIDTFCVMCNWTYEVIYPV